MEGREVGRRKRKGGDRNKRVIEEIGERDRVRNGERGRERKERERKRG